MSRFLSFTNIVGALFLILALVLYSLLVPQSSGATFVMPEQNQTAAQPQEFPVSLYFLGETGYGLVPETRTLQLAAEDNLAAVVTQTFLSHLEEIGTLPSGLEAAKVYQSGNKVYIDLPEVYRSLPLDIRSEIGLVYGLANSILALDSVEEVEFLLAGRSDSALDHLSLAQPFKAQESSSSI